MAVLIESQASQLARATADIAHVAAVGPLDGAKIHLVKANIAITPNILLATLAANEADFTGYAATALVWDVPGFSQDNVVEVVSVPIIFRPSDDVSPNSIWAVYVTNSGSSVWYYAGQVDNPPIALPDATHQLIASVRFRPASNTLVVTIS